MRLALALLTLAALAMPLAAADSHGDCDAKGWPALGIVTIGTGEAGSTTFYVDDRNYFFGNGVWLYEESNLASGLQRGGSSNWVPDEGSNDICTDDSVTGPDQLVF